MTTAARLMRTRRPPGAIANPSTLTGLKVWLKAADLALADNAAVASWTDAATGLAFAQAIGANQPTYKTTAFNGLPCVRFDGTNDSLAVASSVLTVASRTVVIVCRSGLSSITTTEGLLSLDNILNFYVGVALTTGRMRSVYKDGSNVTTTVEATSGNQFLDTTQRLAVAWVHDTSGGNVTTVLRKNGTDRKRSTSAAGNTTPTATTIRVGALTNTGNWFNGDIAELLAWNRALSTAELLSVERYAGNKYGITVS
jgi:hypothetical protein